MPGTSTGRKGPPPDGKLGDQLMVQTGRGSAWVRARFVEGKVPGHPAAWEDEQGES